MSAAAEMPAAKNTALELFVFLFFIVFSPFDFVSLSAY
jgi:hypothetical protein